MDKPRIKSNCNPLSAAVCAHLACSLSKQIVSRVKRLVKRRASVARVLAGS